MTYSTSTIRETVRHEPPPTIHGPEDVARLARPAFGDGRREMFLALLLNARHELLRIETVSVGSLNASIVHPREVFRRAMLDSAAAVILAHNHPSGDPEPSDEDLIMTKRLAEVGELVGIAVLDHVIIAGDAYLSLRARDAF